MQGYKNNKENKHTQNQKRLRKVSFVRGLEQPSADLAISEEVT